MSLRLVRVSLMLLVLPLLLGALPPDERARDIARIEDYLNGLRSMKARFVQFAPNGGRATGALLYERPDKMRLDYDPPSPVLIIANGWELIYHDRKLEQTSHLFTSSTPLGFLLEDHIRLRGDVTVTDFGRRDGQIMVTLIQTDEPDEGGITLFFDDDPIALRRWAVTDAQGQTTHVVLDEVQLDVPIDDALFRFRDPRMFPGARDK
jgi:outer membrane lipoprotein-sorting protein